MFFFFSKFDDLKFFLEFYVLMLVVNSMIHLIVFKLLDEIVIRSFVRLDV